VPFLDVEGGSVWYEEAGEGPPVLLLHSTLVDRRQWDDQMRSFSRQFRVIRFDLRGFGRSPMPTESYRPLEDIAELLRSLDAVPAALVGGSAGGALSLLLTLEHPEMVSALVLVASGAPRFEGWSDELRALWEATEAALLQGDQERAQRLELGYWVPAGRFGDDDKSDRRIARIAADNTRAAAEAEDFMEGPDTAPLERLGEIRVPTLVVLAEHDEAGIRAIGEAVAAGVPGARLVTIPGTDHLVNMRNPGQFDRAVAGFLAEAIR
jgi:pimeloyl-ACP methyl ester carboxylesterase